MQLYTVNDGEVEISEILNESISALKSSLLGNRRLEDDEWNLLLGEDLIAEEEDGGGEGETIDMVAPTSKRGAIESTSTSMKKQKSDQGPSNMQNKGISADAVAVSALPKPLYVPLDLAQVDMDSWVLVQYQGKDFLGKVVGKSIGHLRVQCLTKPYGYRLAQEFEKACDALDYITVYEAPILPWSSELDDYGNRTRKTFYKY